MLRTLERFCETGYGDIKLLNGPAHILRLRSGDWRIFLVADYESKTVTVIRILHRREAYR